MPFQIIKLKNILNQMESLQALRFFQMLSRKNSTAIIHLNRVGRLHLRKVMRYIEEY